ncbi:MAG: hypothetical protein P8Z37_08570 [Acidobacteriota bacterium]
MSSNEQENSYKEREVKEFRFYPGGKLAILSKVPGSIRIIGWDKSEVRVELEKIARSVSPDYAKSLFEKHPLYARHNQTSANIGIEGSPLPVDDLEFNFEIYVPGYKTDLKATLDNGGISVDAVNGWVEVSTGQGRLDAVALSGYYSGSTQDGDIRVEMSGRRWRGLELDAITQTGSIDLLLPDDYSASLQLETRDGNLTVDYPPQIVDGEPVPLNVGIQKKARSLDASIGSGGAPVRLVSRMGDIHLSRKTE